MNIGQDHNEIDLNFISILSIIIHNILQGIVIRIYIKSTKLIQNIKTQTAYYFSYYNTK